MRLSAPASALITAAAAGGLLLSGCGSDGDSAGGEPSSAATASKSPAGSSSASASTTPKPAPVTVELTVRGDSISPDAKVVKVKRGKPVVFVIDSDRAGSLHVHSSPEQEPTFTQGRSKVSVTLDRPGVVEVEEHEAGVLVAQLEVR